MKPHRLALVALAGVVLLSLLSWQTAVGRAETLGTPEHFFGSYLDLNSGLTGPIEFDVQRWSTLAELIPLVQTLFNEGPERLLDEVRGLQAVGRIHTPGSFGYELRYAQQRSRADGGREIILVADRPIGGWEIANSLRSLDYPFTWVQFRMGSNGIGEGKLTIAARIVGDDTDQLIEVHDFAVLPILLRNIQSRLDDD